MAREARPAWRAGLLTLGVALVAPLGAAPAVRADSARVASMVRLDAEGETARAVGPSLVNLSTLLYRAAPRPARVPMEDNDCVACGPSAKVAPLSLTPPALTVTPWNSANARKLTATKLALGAQGATLAGLGLAGPGTKVMDFAWQGGFVCTEPHVTVAGSGCCSYYIKDQLLNQDILYRQPLHAFSDPDAQKAEQKCRQFAATVKASLPLFVPYRDPSVTVVSGWLYGPGKFHGAIDYCKSSYASGDDPTFAVHAVGPGKVLAAYWDDWFGNTVVIEHAAPDGGKYRTVYMHLRDGFTHDLAKAKALTIPSGQSTDAQGNPTNWLKYQRYANKANPSKLLWGTDAQKIAVKAGDQVSAGQFLAWSGDTGAGGAGNGLKDDGTPADPVTANNHLHLMMAVPNPAPGSKEWVEVDPYGVYSDAGSNCYNLLDDTAFVRLIAPFYPSFHNVPVDVLAKYFGYYPGMGYGLQTLSLHRNGNQVLASGAFEYGLPSQWYARFYMTGDDFQHWFDTYHQEGYRPRELAVTLDGGGQPRYTAIWQKRGNESYYTWPGLTDAEWQAKWSDLVDKQHYRVEDHFEYNAGGTPRHAVIFVKDADSGFYEFHNLDSPAFQAKFDDLGKQGWRLVSLNVAELPAGRRYGGVWRKAPGAWVAYYGMSPEVYQEKFTNLSGQGYHLHKIQGYADSNRFAAIWTK